MPAGLAPGIMLPCVIPLPCPRRAAGNPPTLADAPALRPLMLQARQGRTPRPPTRWLHPSCWTGVLQHPPHPPCARRAGSGCGELSASGAGECGVGWAVVVGAYGGFFGHAFGAGRVRWGGLSGVHVRRGLRSRASPTPQAWSESVSSDAQGSPEVRASAPRVVGAVLALQPRVLASFGLPWAFFHPPPPTDS